MAAAFRGVWHAVFHMQVSLGEKVVRSVLVYLLLVVALRLAGKRELGQANTLDLVVLLLVANAVQNGIIGNDLSVTGAGAGAATLFLLNGALSRGIFRFGWLERALGGDPTVLIEGGRLRRDALRRERISLPELRSIARRQGFPDLAAVHSAILETNGTISMFREDEPGHYHPDEPLGLRVGKRRRAPHTRG